MIETTTTKETLVRLFYYLVEQFDADRFAGFTGVYQFYLAEMEPPMTATWRDPHPVPLPARERGPNEQERDLKESPTTGGGRTQDPRGRTKESPTAGGEGTREAPHGQGRGNLKESPTAGGEGT